MKTLLATTSLIAAAAILGASAQAQERVTSVAGSPPPVNVAGGDIPPPPDRQIEYSPYPEETYPNQVFFGDTHLHTAYSADAGLAMATTTPDDAYRFAKGETITSSQGVRARLQRPLDFLVVTDHAENLGVAIALEEENPVLEETQWGRTLIELFGDGGIEERLAAYEHWFGTVNTPGADDPTADTDLVPTMWERMTQAAEDHNNPGQFTAFIGFEWTSGPDGNNLHRNIVFRDGKDVADRIGSPYSTYDSDDPEELWTWMEGVTERTGARIFAIPHNGNLSNGLMFDDVTLSGGPLTRGYAERRQSWEPIYEVTQIKGDGEAHPMLSPNDEFADYYTWDKGSFGPGPHTDEMLPREYAREALKRGLAYEADLGVNPFRFGLVGSTDAHTAISSTQEDNYFGKVAMVEPTADPVRFEEAVTGRFTPDDPGDDQVHGIAAAAGLAAVWARENTREALWDAMKRREVFATTGTRLRVRVFGGYDFTRNDMVRSDFARHGYENGVPMGGDLARSSEPPKFLVRALRDPDGANLDRIQMVKGWLDEDGETHEIVYDIALSDGRKDGAEPVGNTVDIDSATYTNSIGDPFLEAWWEDPDFDPDERAFYYVRVLEIPTPTWVTFDAKFFGVTPLEEAAKIAQERAYTSPIWYDPRG